MFTIRFLHVLVLARLAIAWVDLDPSLIPALPDTLPVLSLGSPSFLPDEWLQEIVANVAPGATIFKGGPDNCTVYAYDGDDLIGFVNEKTGETRLFPDYAKIKAALKPIDIKHALSALGAGNQAFPVDDTHVELIKGSSLVGGTIFQSPEDENSSKRWNDDPPESTFVAHGIAQRSVECGGNKYPVCGPGSQATFGVGPDNKIVSISYTWRAAKKSEKSVKVKAADKTVAAIKAALERTARKSSGLKIYHVDACFYDSGVAFLQPVFRVYGTYADEKNNTITTTPILRYFPVGEKSLEDLPDGASEAETPPVDAQTQTPSRRSVPNYFEARALQRAIKPTITVGRYVTRNATEQADFLANANVFWANLKGSSLINFVDSQYYWAEVRLYGSQANTFVNSVNLVLTESHGGNHLFSTYSNWGDVDAVTIPTTLPATGYGPGPNNDGHLAYWIINACEVIPARIDYPNDPAPLRRAFDPWWPVFRGGLHAVMGWRTSPFFADNVAVNTATAMAQGRPVASAWLDAAHTDPAFNGRPTYVGHYTGILQPNGRASVIYPCGHGSDKVWQIENLGVPTCLEMRYFNND